MAGEHLESHGPPSAQDQAQPHGPHGGIIALTIGALGVVYGDIGTSPLYAINEVFFGKGAIERNPENVLGGISLVIWALSIVVAFKYLIFVLRADNDGEGGTFALYGLLHKFKARGLASLLFVLMLGAGLLFGEGIITPAISVLSAVEGLKIATPALERWVVPITIVIITGLFVIQSKGTAKVGRVFGPIVVVWFVSIGVLGLRQLLRHPEILHALDPRYGLRLMLHFGPRATLVLLGGVVLAVTGTEALYADMGHFGRKPIRWSFVLVVYPALLLNYLGQGAFLMGKEAVAGDNVFYSLVPDSLIYPMVILATCATIIASQALISGAFSLSSQAIALGLFPRLRIVHTHKEHVGQIYVPFINAALWAGCISLVLAFRSSGALAAAYGLAVSGVMCATTMAMVAVARLHWKTNPIIVVLVLAVVAPVDASFLAANTLKFLDGGYIPLSIGLLLFSVMAIWRWGRKATFSAYSGVRTMTLRELVAKRREEKTFIERNVILMVPKPLTELDQNTPALLQLFLDRYGLLPRNLIFVEILHPKQPYVHRGRYRVTTIDRDREHPERGSVLSVAVSFGFLEDPNVERVLEDLARHHEIDLPPDPHLWSVHVSQENLVPSAATGIVRRVMTQIFSLLRQVAQPSYYYYGLGDEVNLSVEIMPVRGRDTPSVPKSARPMR